MIRLIEENRHAFESLCRKHRVARLDIFGSAASSHFDPVSSDVDFLVEFEPREPGPLADAYFGLLADLEQLLERRIDLVTPRAIRNPYFQREVNETRRTVYAA